MNKIAMLIMLALVIFASGCVGPTENESSQIQNNIITANENESSSNVVQHSNDYDGKTVIVNGQVILSSNPGNYIVDGTTGIKLEENLPVDKGFYMLTGIYDAKKNVLTIQRSLKL